MSKSVFLSPQEQNLVESDRKLLALINRYGHVEERLEDDDAGNQRASIVNTIRTRLGTLKEEHEEFRQLLEERDLLPHAPEKDLEDLKRLAATVRAWIESDQTQALLSWLIESEQDWQNVLENLESNPLEKTQIKPLHDSALAAIDALSEHYGGDV